METTTAVESTRKSRGQPYGWWFESHDTSLGCSPWLHSTLSELNEKTRAMLRMIEEDADTFTERVEMYYEKRPRLISFVEDFYRAQRSLLEQIAHLRHDHLCTRHCHISPLPCSYKSCDVSFPSKDPPKAPLDDSDVGDFLSDVCHGDGDEDLGEEFASMQVKSEKTMEEIDRLREDNMVRDQQIMDTEKTIEELQRRLPESENIVVELMRQNERLRVENVEMNVIKKRYEVERDRMKMNLKVEIETLNNQLVKRDEENEEQRELLNMKDDEKREVIRQLSLVVELLKGENVFLKKRLVALKRWRFFDSHMLQLSRLFDC